MLIPDFYQEIGNSAQSPEPSKAMNAQGPGGIDLTANRMKVDVESDKAMMARPMNLKVLENIEINGLYIKDIEITPLTNLPEALGIAR